MAEDAPSAPPEAPKAGNFAGLSDEDFYSWTTLFSLMRGNGNDLDKKRYRHLKDTVNQEMYCQQCEKWKEESFAKNPLIRFLGSEIAKVGPPLQPSAVRCRMCWSDHQSGGVAHDYGILLCANQLRSRSHLADTLAHEMVHAYDLNRFEVDGEGDLRHAACMEIRASTLSGECRFLREVVGNGQWGLMGKFQDCVRRRATLSVMARPACGGDRNKAAGVVEQVWESCFKDTRPFDEIYR